MTSQEFSEITLNNWSHFLSYCLKLKSDKMQWVYRGQRGDWDLKTRLERACEEFELLEYAEQIEFQLIREFRRRYVGIDHDLVQKDTLYCLALMQHHGAPTRLLDFSYSPFVAAYFALESKPKEKREEPNIVYCFNVNWLLSEYKPLSINRNRPFSKIKSISNMPKFLPSQL